MTFIDGDDDNEVGHRKLTQERKSNCIHNFHYNVYTLPNLLCSTMCKTKTIEKTTFLSVNMFRQTFDIFSTILDMMKQIFTSIGKSIS